MIDLDPKGHYARLGVAPTASPQEITRNYRRLMMRYHPDRPGGDAAITAAIMQAYQVLSDPERRQFYDDSGIDGVDQGVMKDAIGQLKHFFTAYLDKGGDENPIHTITECLNRGINEQRTKIAGLHASITKLELRRGAIKPRRRTDDLFESIRQEKLAALRSNVLMLERSIAIAECCLQLAKNYEYIAELAPQPARSFMKWPAGHY